MERLKAELHHLITVRRPEIAALLHEMLDTVDFEDNEQLPALEEMAVVEGRIQELERLLANVEIIVPGRSEGVVTLGSRVTVQEDGESPEIYTVVGTVEARSRDGMISDVSPLGKSLMGRRPGEEVTVQTPAGPVKFRLIAVE